MVSAGRMSGYLATNMMNMGMESVIPNPQPLWQGPNIDVSRNKPCLLIRQLPRLVVVVYMCARTFRIDIILVPSVAAAAART